MNFAKKVNDQTNQKMRQARLGPSAGVTVTEGGGGTVVIVDPGTNLAALIARLTAETDGASGADYIGATPIALTGAADTVQEILEALAGLVVGRYAEDFDNTDSIVVTHNLGKRPLVQAIGQAVTDYGTGLYGAGTYGGTDSTANAVLTPSSIIHDSLNQLTVTLAAAATGEVVCIG